MRALFVLLPIFGITWLFGIFGVSENAVAAMYVFVSLNSSQGLFIFIFQCVLNYEVRKVFCKNRQIQSKAQWLSPISHRPPLQVAPSRNSDCSNKDLSRISSAQSVKENGEILEDVQEDEGKFYGMGRLAVTPNTFTSSSIIKGA
ncbi:adhesion G-protein coupled receptor D1-like [Xenia sp. Carnegie-2017]|uniref:adhesion G-protein coupled receptor D1-like n=1 Tax=Xenia sp. Carnegie-2017 TaxID=2897299 RepID=UPI001F048D2B|nr:adhesion G-protein coupled receptor D1-like [Xenia sp. Carnegie-2017]